MRNELLAPVLVLSIAVLGCSSVQKMVSERLPSNTASESGTGNTASADNAEVVEDGSPAFTPSGDARADIESMSDRFLGLDHFRASMTGTGKTNLQADMDFVAPDRFRLTTMLPTGGSTEMIVIGKSTYLRFGDKWQKTAMDIGSSVPDMRKSFTREGLKAFKEIKFEGDDTVDGRSAYRYSYIGEVPGSGGGYDSRIWISRSSGLPLKVDAEYRESDLKSMSITYDYDTPVTIEPPIGN